jgi:hypothetical protein
LEKNCTSIFITLSIPDISLLLPLELVFDDEEWSDYNECVFNKVEDGEVDEDDHKDCIEDELDIDIK